MAVTADSVVVELLAKTDAYTAKINGAATATEVAMSKIEKSASKTEAEIQKSADRKAAAEERAASRIAEAAEKARIRLEEASAKAALKAEQDAAKRAAAEETAAARIQATIDAEAAKTAAAAERAALAAEAAAKRKVEANASADVKASAAADAASARAQAAAERAAVKAEAAAQRKAAADEKAALRSAAAAEAASAREQAATEKAAREAERDAARKAAAEEAAAAKVSAAVERAFGRAANGSRNLGRQVADVGAQLSGGQSPFLILAQQAPQVADALADTGGRAAQVASFFAGPWGAALLAASSVLGVLVGKALEAGDSLDDLVDKLKESAEKTQLTAEAQRIFEGTAEGAAAAVDKMNEALERTNRTQERSIALDLARAKSLREVAIRALVAAEAEAQRTRDESAYASSNTFLLRAGPGAGLVQSQYANEAAQAETRLQKARQARVNAERDVVNTSIPAIDGLAAAASDKAAAATRRHALALNQLRDAYVKSQLSAKTNEERERGVRAYREGRTRIDTGLAAEQRAISEGNKKGPSAETLARRAEAERVRAVRNNEAYNNELESLNQSIIQASRAHEVDVGKLAEYSRQEVASALAKRNAQIAADESAGKYARQQAANLRDLAKQDADLKNLNINTEEIRRRADEQNGLVKTRLDVESDQLQAQLSISESINDRKELERQLLDLRFKQLKIEQDAVLHDTTGRYTDVQRQQAQITRDALPALQGAAETGVDQRYRSSYENFRRSIDDIDNLNASLDAVKIDSLEAVTDELTKATVAALGLKGAFGQIVGELIRIGIQRAIIGPLADSLFGAASGGGGAVGGFLSSLFGRASGGYVGPGQTVRVNESRGGAELLRMGAQGGTVIPLGQAAAMVPQAASQPPIIIQLSAQEGAPLVPLIQQVSGAQTVQIVKASAPAMVNAATANTMAEIRKMRM